jgi:hypothetical protein
MVDAKSKRRRASARSRTLGVAASVAAHVLFLGFLALSARIQQAYGPSHAVDVQLIAPAAPRARLERVATSAKSRARIRPKAPPAPTTSPIAAPAIPPQASQPTTPMAPAGLAAALRRGLGCDHADFMNLAPAERERCRDLFAAARGGVSELADFGIDPRKRVIFDSGAKRDRFLQEPFLAERPRKGCRPIVTEHDVPANAPAPHDWTFSVACGVPF